MKKYFLIIITILLNFTATAQLAGTLNTAFSQDGYDDTFFGGNPGLAFPVTETIIQPDGKILICVGAKKSIIITILTKGRVKCSCKLCGCSKV